MVSGSPTQLGSAASRFFGTLPALVLALAGARAFELVLGDASFRAGSLALMLDALALAKALPPLFLVSLPFLLIESRRARLASLGAVWTVLVVLAVVLMQYGLTTRVALGADLLGYSREEVVQTLMAGATIRISTVLHMAVPLVVLWSALALDHRAWQPSPRIAWAALAAGVAALLVAPGQGRIADAARADSLVLDKPAYLVEDIVRALNRPRTVAVASPAAGSGALAPAGPNGAPAPAAATDPRYPFLHAETTPDVLGPLFEDSATPPNLVFVIVEGLGRSFSGPDASHGSFTPFLDDLATRSLTFDNFLANQGRTFAALPTIFGSLPFGDEGFAALADRKPLPAHLTLLSILAEQGWHTRFYAGFDVSFDEERPFLVRQKTESIIDSHDFGPSYTRANSWGYGDGDLVARTLADESRALPEPSVVVVQTVTLHTPYTFPRQADYRARFEQRLDELGISGDERAKHRESSNIYTAALYTDDALRALVDGLSKLPSWGHTILVITGDHCLPELPMATRIERYHVPLVIHSPMLKAPARIKSVSSQMDLVPSLLAFLSNRHGVRTPKEVAWLGTGLDLEPSFRNVHDIPLKLAKRLPADFMQGHWYLSRGQLFRIGDRMTENPADDADALASVTAAMQRFAAANDLFATRGELMPESALPSWAAYRPEERAKVEVPAAAKEEVPAVTVTAVRVPSEAHPGKLEVEADFTNPSTRPGRRFAPMAVLLTGDGRELTETYGGVMQLAPGQNATVSMTVKSKGLPAGRYFLAVIPSDPSTGKAVGLGRYHLPVHLR